MMCVPSQVVEIVEMIIIFHRAYEKITTTIKDGGPAALEVECNFFCFSSFLKVKIFLKETKTDEHT